MTRQQEEAPVTRGYEGQTNTTDCTLPPADRYPSHPANLLPALAEHLLMVAFGASWAAASGEAVKIAQGLALTITVVRGVVSRKPVPAWRVAKLAGGEGAMLSAYARLAGDMAVTVTDVGEVGECREVDFTGADEALVPQNGTQMFKFQHDVVRWALRLGKAAIFADCGLGKTMMQLQWAWQVANNPRGGGRFGRFPACSCRADNSRGQEVRN